MVRPVFWWHFAGSRRRLAGVSIEDDVARHTGLVDGQPLTEAEAEGWIPKTCFKH
jgi:hypothetical protein